MKETRDLSELFFVAVPDEKDRTRAAGARESLGFDLMSYTTDRDGQKKPVRIFNLTAVINDGIVTVVATAEEDGKAVDRLRFTHDTRGYPNGE